MTQQLDLSKSQFPLISRHNQNNYLLPDAWWCANQYSQSFYVARKNEKWEIGTSEDDNLQQTHRKRVCVLPWDRKLISKLSIKDTPSYDDYYPRFDGFLIIIWLVFLWGKRSSFGLSFKITVLKVVVAAFVFFYLSVSPFYKWGFRRHEKCIKGIKRDKMLCWNIDCLFRHRIGSNDVCWSTCNPMFSIISPWMYIYL